MIFSDSWLLWFLVPIFVVWAAACHLLPLWLRRQGRAVGLRFSSLGLLRGLRPSSSIVLRRVVQSLRLLCVALLLAAMARPQTGRVLTEVQTEGVDIILVLDTSGSMKALDLDTQRALRQRRDRLEVAKAVVENFVGKRPNDQVGLVVFGEEAFTQCPLTLDHNVLLTLVDRVEIGMAGADRTAIGSAIGIAVKRLRQSQAESKVIVLLTDGRSNAGTVSPQKAAEIAATFDIKIYTVGAATRGKAPFLVDSVFGQRVLHQDAEIDEETLKAIAEQTGGTYFRAEDGAALLAVYDEIDQLEKTEITTSSFVEYEERFVAFVAPAMLLLLLEVILLGTRFRKLP